MIKRFNNLRIATKLFLILLVPLAGLLYISIDGVVRQAVIAADTRRFETLISFSTQIGATVHEIQKERGTSVLFLSSRSDQAKSEMLAQRAVSDSEIAKFQVALQNIDANAYGDAFQANIKNVTTALETIAEKRKQIDAFNITADESSAFYTETIDALLTVVSQSTALNNAELARYSSAYLALLQAKERAGRERANLSAALNVGQFSADEFHKFLTISNEQDTYFKLFLFYASDEERAFYRDTVKGPFVDEATSIEQGALKATSDVKLNVDAQRWFNAATGRINLLKEVENKVADDLLKSASGARQAAVRALWFFIATAAIAVAFAAVSIFFARSISGALQSMTNTAQQVAGGDLNQHIAVDTQDEIGVLAGAFNDMTAQLRRTLEDVNRRAVELATVAEVGTATATILETDKLLQEVVDLSKERFNLYHSHIFLLDEKGENLVLASGAGEAGAQMKAKGLSIPLNREQSLVARAARDRKGVTVNDVTQAPDFLANPLLPNTRSELAVPMVVGDKVIGVFDVQSDVVGRFTDSDINIQTTLASQVATSIQNVRSFEQSKEQADLEAMVNAINQKIQRSDSINDALQIAARELGLALGSPRVSVQIQSAAKATDAAKMGA